MRESLKGLEFKNFEEIPDFDKKLSDFLKSLGEELTHWRDYDVKEDKRIMSYPIAGYACLDGDNIVAISYYTLPKKFSIPYFVDLLFQPKAVGTGSVTKSEYQRRGISKYLGNLKDDFMRKMGIRHYWSRVDSDNIAILKWAEQRGMIPVKITRKTLYYVTNLFDDHSGALRIRAIIELIVFKTRIMDFLKVKR